MYQKQNVAVQTYHSINEHELCASCGQITNHPICPCCLSKSFKTWLREFPQLQKETTEKLNHYLKRTKDKKGTHCIRCNQKKVHICPYCFTNYLYSLIKEGGAGITVLTHFLYMFNFDFERKGYAQELQQFGGY